MDSQQPQFWTLRAPESMKERVEWDEGMDWEGVVCPTNPGHQRAGRRITDLQIVLPNPAVSDFVWTPILTYCAIQEAVLNLFQKERIKGFEVRPVKARFARSKETPPVLWELVVTGWAGLAPPESGIVLDKEKSCPACGLLRYTGMTDGSKLIKLDQWDGSDVFMVWPMPKYIFITDRVREVIQRSGLTGCLFGKPDRLPKTSQLGAGRLSHYMPEERARELGEPLGIY